MSTFWQDIRYGMRRLRKSPGFTAVAVLTLAIGIGANATTFSIVNGLLLRPAQVRRPDQLVGCYLRHRSTNAYAFFSYGDYVQMREHNSAFDDLMAYAFEFVALEEGNLSKRSTAEFVSSNYFASLGTAPVLGRGFLPEEERSGCVPVAVLSDRGWKRLGRDPGILGSPIRVNNTFVQVVGVAAEGFTGPVLTGPDLWLPLGCYGATRNEQDASGELYPSLMLIGRLKKGLSMHAAEAQIEAVALRLGERDPDRWREQTLQLACLARFGIGNSPATAEIERRKFSIVSLFLIGISIIILLIACHNMAHLYLVKGSSRLREIAMRMAVGGSRWRILRQLMVESLLLTGLGGGLGLLLAAWGVAAVNGAINHLQLAVQGTIAFEGRLDGRVLTATLGLGLLATLLSGLQPAWRLTRRDIVRDLKETGGVAPRANRMALRRFSCAFQVASSVVLIMAAVLLGRSAMKALHATPGYSPAGKLLVESSPEMAGYDHSQGLRVCEAVLDELQTVPGIRHAALSSYVPFGHSLMGCSVTGAAPERGNPQGAGGAPSRAKSVDDVIVNHVSGDYFQAIELPLLQGRAFGRLDSQTDASRVVIIDEPLARRLYPGGNALGQLIQMDNKPVTWEVVGIAPGLRHTVFDKEVKLHIYLPFGRESRAWRLVYVNLRIQAGEAGDEASPAPRIADAIRRVDHRIPILSLASVQDFHKRGAYVWFARTAALLVIGFGALALFLAALGIYEVKACQAAARIPEIGVRMALGATRRHILGALLREGAALTLAGVCAGLVLAFIAARAIAGILCDIAPLDLSSICATVLLVGVTSLLAGYLPARRAAKVDPMTALRCE